MSIKIPYKKKFSLEERRAESKKIRDKYSDRIPIIVTPSGNAAKNHPIEKEKFLVPTDLTLAQFVYVIRKRIKLNAEEALWVFVHNTDGTETLPPTSSSLSAIYQEHVELCKDDDEWDGFLYIVYSGENTFGC